MGKNQRSERSFMEKNQRSERSFMGLHSLHYLKLKELKPIQL